MRGYSPSELRDRAVGLQSKRKTLLSELKGGLVLVPCDVNVGINDSKDEESQLYDFIRDLFSKRDLT